MISTSRLALAYGKRVLFDNVTLNFSSGNCYGVIGANGSGKSTFIKILAGEIEPTRGDVSTSPSERISYLRQNQYEFDEFQVLQTVVVGHSKLYQIIEAKEALYAKTPFTEEDGIKVSELEASFAEMNGWEAEAEAAKLLSDLGVKEKLHGLKMKELGSNDKVRVLLAQALFGNPDILLLDEPTNHLDVETIMWLEDFLYEFKNTVIVVSHDRHFLDRVCTHVADIDFGSIQVFPGNWSFWQQSRDLIVKQKSQQNRQMEEKRKDLTEFILRFSNNASKSRQATARKKLLEKLTLEDIKPSSRRYPHIFFKPSREAGNDVLIAEDLSKSADGKPIFKNISFRIDKGEKVVFVSRHDLAVTAFFQLIAGETSPDAGKFKWGASVTKAYFPKDNARYFENR